MTDALVSTLQKRSDERRAEDPEFQKQAAAIQRYIARKARHEVSLNEKTYRAEVDAEELDAEAAKDKKDGEPKRLHDRDIWPDDPYNDEVLDILGDYINLGGEILTAGPVPAGNGRQALRP